MTKVLARAAKPAGRVPVRRPGPAPALRLERAAIQPALKVGPANDPFEHEAEATAERVATMSAPSFAADDAPPPAPPGAPAEAGAMRAMPEQTSQPDTDEFESAPTIPADHQDPEIPATEDVDTAGVDGGEFSEIEAGEPARPEELLRDTLPAAAVGREGGAAPDDVARVVAQPGPGRPLPDGVRAFMEPRFGVSFRDVRLHDAPADRRAAARIGARAFTHRRDIWMGEGESADDRRLMAHELTHVVQQTRREPGPGGEGRAAEVRQTDEAAALRRGYLANKAEKYARKVPGYFLLTVILGKSPITGDRVPRTAENLIGGFLGLLPGGDIIFQKLQESRALQRAFDWVSSRLSELNITWSRIKGLVSDFIDKMPSFSPVKIAKRIFKPLVDDIITFIRDVKDKILEFIVRGALALAGPYGEKIWGVIEKAREVISLILENPIQFAKNLVRAIVGGFRQFRDRIGEHLKAGLMGWLFGTLQGAGIDLPEKLDFKGVVSVALQILGLTYANFRAMLVKKLGVNGERKVAYLEKSVEVVRILVKDGFLGIWQRLVEMLESFKQTVIDGIRDFVVKSLVMGAVSWIAGLSNPIGGIVKICLSIYNMIVTFIERLDQIVELAGSIFSSIGAIARGQLKQASDFVEKTIAKTIPLFLAFVAALIPVTGITNTIRNVIKRLQAPVKKAMGKMVDFLVKKAKKIFAKMLGRVNDKRELAKKGFRLGRAGHDLVPKKTGAKFGIEIASEKPKPADAVQDQLAAEAKRAQEFGDDAACVDLFEKSFKLDVDKAEAAAKKISPKQKKTPTRKPAAAAEKELDAAAKTLDKHGPCIAENPFFDDKPEDGAIIRAREPRLPEIEGASDLYNERGKVTSQVIADRVKRANLGARGQQKLSNFYENDHIPEKSLAFKVREYLDGKLKTEIDDGMRDGSALPERPLGDIGTRALGAKGEQLPAITVYRPIHRQKTKDDAKRDYGAVIARVDAKKNPAAKITALQAEIADQMKKEMESELGHYAADKAASGEIKGKVNAGMRNLVTLNKTLYGFDPEKPPQVKEEGEPKPGSDLDMNGDPNFAELEGQYALYGKKPDGVGNFLEYDHIVEKALANRARDMKLGEPALKEGLDAAVEAKLAGENLKTDALAARKTEAGKRLGRAYERLVFAGKPARGYDENKAGTVALYRPVHREITAAQKIPDELVPAAAWTPIREKLATYAAGEKDDRAALDAVLADARSAVRATFIQSMSSHTSLIGSAYQVEMKDFVAINKSKTAASKMAGIVARVDATTKTLHAESLALLGSG